jgi:hypothetical protein
LLLVISSLLLLGAAPGGGTKPKYKHKTFQPVVMSDVHKYAGRYVGVDTTYFVVVRTEDDQKLAATVHEGSTTSALRDVHLNGALLVGTLTAPDGKSKTFEAVFGERDINGRRAFGLLVSTTLQLPDDVLATRIFCKRQ